MSQIEVKLYSDNEPALRWMASGTDGLTRTLADIATNYRQSDQWQGQEIVLVIRPHRETEEAELRARLKRVTEALYD